MQGNQEGQAPYTLPVAGGFVPFLFCLAALYVRRRPATRGPEGPANTLGSDRGLKLFFFFICKGMPAWWRGV